MNAVHSIQKFGAELWSSDEWEEQGLLTHNTNIPSQWSGNEDLLRQRMASEAALSNLDGKRVLAAIVFTSAVDFSERMSIDEERAFNLIRRDFQVMRHLCQQFEGQVFKSIGDSLLMCFNSAVNAVNWAIAAQHALTEQAAQLPPENVLQHRIGIHLGDVFFSGSDIMGNGVNIAMQLQADVKAGGIYISQPLYDVVKWSVGLNVAYLGEHQLKNLRQPLPIYQVLLTPADGLADTILPSPSAQLNPAARLGQIELSSEQTLRTTTAFVSEAQPAMAPEQNRLAEEGVSVEDTMIIPLPVAVDPYVAVAQELSHTEYPDRVRKLLLFAARNTWESNSERLRSLVLPDLLAELLAIASTPQQLHTLLYDIVNRLNKKAEYLKIAEIILHEVEPLYPHTGSQPPNPYLEIAQRLENSDQGTRIKKLLLWTCRLVWENDRLKLTQLKLEELLPELMQLAPTLEQLKLILDKSANSLNKAAEYTQLAEMILEQVASLYPPSDPSPPAPQQVTTWSPIQAEPAPPVEPVEEAALPTIAQTPPQVGAVPPAPSLSEDVKKSPKPSCDPFDLRVELMRHANPLRAKLLMLSALHHQPIKEDMTFSGVAQNQLDDLIQSILQNYATADELTVGLTETALSMTGDGGDEYVQVAEAIALILRPCYN
jgi:class 3 adenylate cyclase